MEKNFNFFFFLKTNEIIDIQICLLNILFAVLTSDNITVMIVHQLLLCEMWSKRFTFSIDEKNVGAPFCAIHHE